MNALDRLVRRMKGGNLPNRNPRIIEKYAKLAEQKRWVPVMERKRQGGRV